MDRRRPPPPPLAALAESMRLMSLGRQLPEQPGVMDCAYYLRNGSCGYDDRCRYNHPPDRLIAGELLWAFAWLFKATARWNPTRWRAVRKSAENCWLKWWIASTGYFFSKIILQKPHSFTHRKPVQIADMELIEARIGWLY